MNVSFTGSWMLVAQWDRVHPFPHGAPDTTGISDEYNAFLESVSVCSSLIVTELGLRLFLFK